MSNTFPYTELQLAAPPIDRYWLDDLTISVLHLLASHEGRHDVMAVTQLGGGGGG
jgi:hypothetical protein